MLKFFALVVALCGICCAIDVGDVFDWTASGGSCSVIADYTGLESVDPNDLFLNVTADNIYTPSLGPLPIFVAANGRILGSNFETPIAYYLNVNYNHVMYNIISAYREGKMDTFGTSHDPTVLAGKICPPSSFNRSNEDENVIHLKHQKAASALALVYQAYSHHVERGIYPGLLDEPFYGSMLGVLGDINLIDRYNQMIDPSYDGCNSTNIVTPQGFAKCMTNRVLDIMLTDDIGWNPFGTTSCTYNCRPFQDFEFTDSQGGEYRPYTRAGNPLIVLPWPNANRRWNPLLESNNKGFLYHQSHVVPYIGFTAVLQGMGNRDQQCQFLQSRRAPSPQYNYRREIRDVFERSKVLENANPDITKVVKAKIELWDNKFVSVAALGTAWKKAQLQSHGGYYDDYADFLSRVATASAQYNAIILSWREKILHNRVRPTTIADSLRDTQVEAWAGPFQGVQTLKAQEWEPYIRTMPHAEYPSASACICQAFQDYQITESGSETFWPPQVIVQPPFSSAAEPGTPVGGPVVIPYTNWTQAKLDCGNSRLDGGMHFTASVPAGYELCDGLGQATYQRALLLNAGNPDGRFVDHTAQLQVCEP